VGATVVPFVGRLHSGKKDMHSDSGEFIKQLLEAKAKRQARPKEESSEKIIYEFQRVQRPLQRGKYEKPKIRYIQVLLLAYIAFLTILLAQMYLFPWKLVELLLNTK
jgi:hypothetical protein